MPHNIILKLGQPKFNYTIYLTSNTIIKDYHIEKLLNSADDKGLVLIPPLRDYVD